MAQGLSGSVETDERLRGPVRAELGEGSAPHVSPPQQPEGHWVWSCGAGPILQVHTGEPSKTLGPSKEKLNSSSPENYPCPNAKQSLSPQCCYYMARASYLL